MFREKKERTAVVGCCCCIAVRQELSFCFCYCQLSGDTKQSSFIISSGAATELNITAAGKTNKIFTIRLVYRCSRTCCTKLFVPWHFHRTPESRSRYAALRQRLSPREVNEPRKDVFRTVLEVIQLAVGRTSGGGCCKTGVGSGFVMGFSILRTRR